MTIQNKSAQMNELKETNYQLPGQTAFYRGKVRDVYTIDQKYLVMIASDRISAFDHILPRCIPFKGQVLNQIAVEFLNSTKHIVSNWLITSPDEHVSVGYICDPIKIEMVIRGYLAGHAWREYKAGRRSICGVALPEGLKENDKLPEPIITPTTKASEGHDEDISEEEILKQKLVDQETWSKLCAYTHKLFEFGSKKADERDLILVDTKYEFGFKDGEIMLMDEIHTPDSSRYFYKEGYLERQEKEQKQEQLSKEFVRQWLISHDFQGLEGQKMPHLPDDFIQTVSERYQDLFNSIVGKNFVPRSYTTILSDVESNIRKSLNEILQK
jgi:phosphoribosylaminoimidazole-succinocarboxamide synthase